MKIDSRELNFLISVVVTGLVFACAAENTQPSRQGRVSVPLNGVSNEGNEYRLLNGRFLITGDDVSITLLSEDYPDLMSADIDLPEGIYSVALLDGWILERLTDDGYVEVEAVLLTENPMTVAINADATTSAVFLFEAGDEIVNMGSGTLSISIEVEEQGAVCDTSYTDCNGVCVDTQTDSSNCGACGTTCADTERCEAGLCVSDLVCIPELTNCNDVCVDTQTDNLNCGSCGTTCTASQHCDAGHCVANIQCNDGTSLCNNVCVNLLWDNANCGACGTTCATGGWCNNGTCVCANAYPVCNGVCTNTAWDPANCGACGRNCGSGHWCNNGTCM